MELSAIGLVWFYYSAVAIALLISGLMVYAGSADDEEARVGARIFILAPVWPIAVAYFIGVGIAKLWNAAQFTKKDSE